jgi:hypothetical protein
MKSAPLDGYLPPALRPASEITVRGWVATIIASGLPLDYWKGRREGGETASQALARIAVERADDLIAAVHRANLLDHEASEVECAKAAELLEREAAGQAARNHRGVA